MVPGFMANGFRLKLHAGESLGFVTMNHNKLYLTYPKTKNTLLALITASLLLALLSSIPQKICGLPHGGMGCFNTMENASLT